MRNDKEFYELILRKHEQNKRRRARRRQVGGAISVIALGAVLIVGGMSLLPKTPPSKAVPSGSETVSNPISTVPSGTTTTTEPLGIGGGEYLYYKRAFREKFSTGGAFRCTDVVSYEEFYAWRSQFKVQDWDTGTRNRYEYNVYNFIHDFNIPRETVERLCAEQIVLYRDKWGYPPEAIDENCLTPREIEMIYTLSKEEVYPYFVNNKTIAIGDQIYTPKWLAEHAAEDYITAGITVEQVEAAYQAFDVDTAPPEAAQYIFEQIQRMKTLQ